MNLPSASSLERAHHCPPSQVLPHFRSRAGHWSRRGTVIHRFLVRCAEVGPETALAEVAADLYDACACIELEKLPPATPDSYAYEVALAYDLENDEARELGRNLEREDAYALARPGEMVGTCDVLSLTEDAVVVLDYKTGFTWFDSVEENYQLMWYALAASRAYKRGRAHLAIIRINEEGHPYFLWGEVTEHELSAYAARLRDLDEHIGELRLLTLAGEPLSPVTGDHCQYCPAVASCPAWMTLARELSSPDANAPNLPPLTADNAALYIEAVKRGKKVLERIERALKYFAEQSPIDLGGGWVYGPHPFPVDEWDVEKAWPILQSFLGEDAGKVLQAKVLKSRIEDVFRERKKADKKVRIKDDTKAVVEALKNQGACTTRFTMPVGEHKPKPQLEEGDANGEGQAEARIA